MFRWLTNLYHGTKRNLIMIFLNGSFSQIKIATSVRYPTFAPRKRAVFCIIRSRIQRSGFTGIYGYPKRLSVQRNLIASAGFYRLNSCTSFWINRPITEMMFLHPHLTGCTVDDFDDTFCAEPFREVEASF